MADHRSYGKNGRSGSRLLLVPAAGILIGVSVMSYPYFSQLYYQHLNDGVISTMTSSYDRYDPDSPEIAEIRYQAERYNDRLSGDNKDDMTVWPYDKQLDLDGTDVMAFVEIPAINVKMPVYHGTGEETLSAGAGHLEGTSLPIGGSGTHCVLTAHSGMKNMEAFDRLGSLKKGDLAAVTTLGETLVYEVEAIETVLPYETDSLAIVPGQDMLTLITCTPYGINDHRLLVHCVRTDRKLNEKTGADDPPGVMAPEDRGSSSGRCIGGIKKYLFSNLRKVPVFISGSILLIMLVSTVIRKIIREKRRKKKYGRKKLTKACK